VVSASIAGPYDWRVVSADPETAALDSPEPVVVELDCDEVVGVVVEGDDEPAALVLDAAMPVLDDAGIEVVIVVGVVVAPCDPVPAITPQARAKVKMLAAAMRRRTHAILLARARRSCLPRAVEAALVVDMGAT
jgi:hypothetical protein